MNIIEMKEISKSFPGTKALDRVDFLLCQGEILSLLGENGAGKTTLMKILYGMVQPDEGYISFKGNSVKIGSPSDAIKLGICMVHQHFMLVPAFTVTENIIIGCEPGQGMMLDYELATRHVRALIDQFHFNIDPDAKVERLSVGEQQRVEILKALYRKAEVIILDEPTAVLTPNEVSDLFVVLEQLRASGKSIVIITHKLKETMAIANRIMILRNGRLIRDNVVPSQTSDYALSEMMVGRNINLAARKLSKNIGKVLFSVKNLNVVDRGIKVIDEISFDIHEGEILGLAGVEGNGQSYLLEAITGLRKPVSMDLTIAGEAIHGGASEFIRSGIAHVPEDRNVMGLVDKMSIRENIFLGYQNEMDFSKHGVLRKQSINKIALELKDRFSIKAPSISTFVKSLSGGNQQKVIIARTISRNPRVLVIAQPTRGIDIGSTEFIHEQIWALRDQGKSIFLVSADLDEVIKLSDRILVIYEGKIVAETRADELSDVQLGILMTGAEFNGSDADSSKLVN